jgi:hypothetical protein
MVYIITPALINYLFVYDNILVDIFGQLLSFVLPICLILIASSKNTKFGDNIMLFQVGDLYKTRINSKLTITSIFIGILLSFVVHYLFHFVEVVYILLTDDYSIINIIPPFKMNAFLGTILVLVIMPSIFEELLYRGMYFDTFKYSKTLWQYLIPTLIFSFAHRGIFSAFSAMILSLILIYYIRQYSSLKLCIIIHFVYNMISIITSNLVSLPYSPLRLLENYATDRMFFGALIIYGGIILFLVTIILLIKKTKSQKISISEIKRFKFSLSEITMISIMLIVSSILFLLRVL